MTTDVLPSTMSLVSLAKRMASNGYGEKEDFVNLLFSAVWDNEIPIHTDCSGGNGVVRHSLFRTADVQSYLMRTVKVDMLTTRAASDAKPQAAPESKADTESASGVDASASESHQVIKKEGFILKKRAAIKKYRDEWSTIKADFNHSSENGLTAAAKAPLHGEWYESALLAWADQRGKRTTPQESSHKPNFAFPSTVHKIAG